ncbi:unnamed protein product [Caenorhabditis angaria]|uniref:TEA domain-containing protein n=1 Tax=Caenorhabditis angaria TaxID=860376 RepID=A0A9P1MY64_9PELO|nr:unnamed protein product [Caenorhabditis angaria]
MSSIFPAFSAFKFFMSEDVANPLPALLSSANGTPFRDFKKEWAAMSGAAASQILAASSGGGQMMTLSPPAGDGAGSNSSTAPEATSSNDLSGDAEGVWSVDIDQAFQEALTIYPPCGRRKIIISEEGKMYGRNELIARYIKLRCGKTRTRKQVSSHIQVLARKKQRDEQTKKKEGGNSFSLPTSQVSLNLNNNNNNNSTTTSRSSSSSSNEILNVVAGGNAAGNSSAPQFHTPKLEENSATTALQHHILLSTLNNPLWNTFSNSQLPFGMDLSQLVVAKPEPEQQQQQQKIEPDVLPIATSSLNFHGFSAYVQNNESQERTELVKIENSLEKEAISIQLFYEKYPQKLRELVENSPNKDIFFMAKCWANINVPDDVTKCQYAVDSFYSSREKFCLKVSTMACSFGNQVVEKIEAYPPTEEADGTFSFILNNSPMCDYMVKFISELKKVDTIEMMNSVLENFTVLQIVTNSETDETLMVICFIFEVSSDSDPSCSVFRLIL